MPRDSFSDRGLDSCIGSGGELRKYIHRSTPRAMTLRTVMLLIGFFEICSPGKTSFSSREIACNSRSTSIAGSDNGTKCGVLHFHSRGGDRPPPSFNVEFLPTCANQ